MDLRENDPAKWPVVISIHGIRTTGRWQKELNDVLVTAGFRHVPMDFGFFSALSLLIPWSRSRKVEWFHREYSEKFAIAVRRPSVIAHSFGSYIVTRAMLKYADIRFERMILCGSIVSRSYPWRSVLLQRDQVGAVLNEAGGRDLWAAVVEWVVSDAGASGVSGFEDTADGRVVQLVHERHEHSDYFYRQNYEQRWLPFLQGRSVELVSPIGSGEVNRKFLFTLCVILLSIAVVLWLVLAGDDDGRFNLWGGNEPAQKQLKITRANNQGLPKQTSVVPLATPDSNVLVRAESQKAAKNLEVNAWFDYLRGEWVYLGDLPQREELGTAFRCVVHQNVLTLLRFESVDSDAGVVFASWRQDGMSTHQLIARQAGPQPYYTAVRERRACLGGQEANPAKRLLEETGRLSVNISGPLDQAAHATLMIEYCTLGGEDCLPAMFGRRPMPQLEKIGQNRLRMGELMFIRQDNAP